MRVRFRCGHEQATTGQTAPICLVCRDPVIAAVLDAPAPRIRGCARGPHVETTPLDAVPVALAQPGAAPLLKGPHGHA